MKTVFGKLKIETHTTKSFFTCFAILTIAVIFKNLDILLSGIEDLSILKFPHHVCIMVNFLFILTRRIIFYEINCRPLKYTLLLILWLFTVSLVTQGINVSIFKDMNTTVGLINRFKNLEIEDVIFLMILYPIPIGLWSFNRLMYLGWSLILSLSIYVRPLCFSGFRGISPLTTSEAQESLDKKASNLETESDKAKNVLKAKEQDYKNIRHAVFAYKLLEDTYIGRVEYAKDFQERHENNHSDPYIIDKAREDAIYEENKLKEWQQKLNIHKAKLENANNELESAKDKADNAKAKAAASVTKAKDFKENGI